MIVPILLLRATVPYPEATVTTGRGFSTAILAAFRRSYFRAAAFRAAASFRRCDESVEKDGHVGRVGVDLVVR